MILAMIPNFISLARVLLTPFVIFLLTRSDSTSFFTGIGFFTLAALTDFWDGLLARRLKAYSDFGAFIDPLADKILILSVLAMFVQQQVMSLGLFFIFAGRDILLTVLRSVLAASGVVWKTSLLAKWKTFLQFLGCTLDLL